MKLDQIISGYKCKGYFIRVLSVCIRAKPLRGQRQDAVAWGASLADAVGGPVLVRLGHGLPMTDFDSAKSQLSGALPVAQQVSAQPRRLLSLIPNLELVAIPEGEICCGSAGMYNIEQPEIARRLGQRKAQYIIECGAQALAAGNIGCLVQIQRHLRAMGREIPVWHTMEVLERAYAN